MKINDNIRACVDNERGSAFVVTLLVFCVVLVMGMGILGSAVTNTRMSEADRDYQSVFYIAESGRDYAVKDIHETVEEKCGDAADSDAFFTAMDAYFYANFPKEIKVFDDQFGETVIAKVSVDGMEDWSHGAESHTYILISEGSIGSVKRKVASGMTLSYAEGASEMGYPIDVGVFSMSTITLLNGTCVDGPVGANTSENGGIYLDWGSTVEDVLLSSGADPDTVIYTHQWSTTDHYADVITMEEERAYPMPEYPDLPNPTYMGNLILANEVETTVDQDGTYNEIKVQDSGVLTIDVGSDVRQIVVDDMTINGNGAVRIIGSGTLLLYVNDTFVLAEGGEFNNNGDDGQATIFYGGSDTFNPTGGVPLFASVFVKDADISLGTGVLITGDIITGGDDVLISGGLQAFVRVIYAPNALVRIIGGGHVNGAVIAERFQMEGGGGVTYNPAASMDDITGITFGSSGPPQVELDVGKAAEIDY